MHLTETCDVETPHLISNVETTPAASPEDTMLSIVHTSLAAPDRLPAEHLAHIVENTQTHQRHGVPVAKVEAIILGCGLLLGQRRLGLFEHCLQVGGVRVLASTWKPGLQSRVQLVP